MHLSIRRCTILTSLLICLPLAGCGGDNLDDLRNYVQEVKARPKGVIEPLPQIRPQETFTYSAADLRDPFTPPQKEAPPPTADKLP